MQRRFDDAFSTVIMCHAFCSFCAKSRAEVKEQADRFVYADPSLAFLFCAQYIFLLFYHLPQIPNATHIFDDSATNI